MAVLFDSRHPALKTHAYFRTRESLAQKVIEGDIVTWRHMHEILRWLKFKLAQYLDHVRHFIFPLWNVHFIH